MLEQVDRCRPQQKKAPGLFAFAPPTVDKAAQALKQLWYSMHLIKNYQFIFMTGEVGFRIDQLGAVCAALKIKIYRGARIANFLRERGFADLSRPK